MNSIVLLVMNEEMSSRKVGVRFHPQENFLQKSIA